MFRPWRSFPLMVVTGLVLGLLTGGSPLFAKEVSTLFLIIAMTLALTEIRLEGLRFRTELRAFSVASFWNYGVLTGLVLVFALLTPDPDLRAGWVVMAAVPSAIAVIPLTSILKGNVRSALVSTALLYGAALVAFPAITLVFAGYAASPADIALQTLLQIGVPIVASRPLARIPAMDRWRPTAVNLSFLVLVTAIVGANRSAFADLGLVAGLSGAGLLRTFGIGLLALALGWSLRRDRTKQIETALFASFKNLGLTAVLAFSFFGATATLPAIVCLVFEILWIGALPFAIRHLAPPVHGGPRPPDPGGK